jgi:hypothetical protein
MSQIQRFKQQTKTSAPSIMAIRKRRHSQTEQQSIDSSQGNISTERQNVQSSKTNHFNDFPFILAKEKRA